MEFVEFFRIFVTVVGIIMSIGYFPQAWRMIKNKSSKDVSITTCIILAVGTFVWTVYGFLINDLVVIISFVVGVIGSWLVLAIKIKYDRQQKSRRNYTTKKP